ncbi:UDP-N-acetylglucosamine--undecaprenyl-phosphate N-acetylglucosaminephosphotransferase [Litoribrevibacter euphylliae]|uniref:Undecaprenyl-phosphate alpha-N-acetylglucosaminyl 1-phosphate transferase n=1 Tax=Litoribrevibacter euphylliae TaxID=1834034 RepID=A0ABV7HFI3_9GAMM
MSTFITAIFAFAATCFFIYLYKPLAIKGGLVDIPNKRKQHTGNIPLIGGLSIYSAYLGISLITGELSPTQVTFLTCSLIMIILGAVDDYKDLSFKLRLVIQAAIALIMVYVGGVKIDTLGNLFHSGEIELGKISAVFTVIAVIGCINAFNMMDGIDGLCSGVTITTLMAIVLFNSSSTPLTINVTALILCLLAYIIFNLQLLGKRIPKIFMGDAGSMFIGFSVVWLLAETTQNSSQTPPVMAIWIIGIPLMDMGAIMIRRTKKGQSPFKPDRNHLHHILMRYGYNARETLVIILGLCLTVITTGYVLMKLQLSEWQLLCIWLTLFFFYSYTMNRVSQSQHLKSQNK